MANDSEYQMMLLSSLEDYPPTNPEAVIITSY
jgi:hypothetical protein